MDQPKRKGVIHRITESDGQRSARRVHRGFEFPFGRIRRLAIGRGYAERFLERLREGKPVGVVPILVNQQGITFASFECRSNFFQWFDAALDPARVDEQGEAGLRAVPEY